MKTYTESKGKKLFNWLKALSKDCGDMTFNEIKKLATLANDWVTCQTGQQSLMIDRNSDGEPNNSELESRGREFSNYVDKMHQHFFDRNLDEANRYRLAAIEKIDEINKLAAQLVDEKVTEMVTNLRELGFKITGKMN